MLGSLQFSCGVVEQQVCAADCPAGPEGPAGPAGPRGPAGAGFGTCQWLYNNCNSAPGVECEQVCPAGTHPVTGSCDITFGGASSESVVALIDLDTPAPGSGPGTIRMLKQASPASMVIAMTRGRSYDDAVDAVRAGAIDLLDKAPASIAHLKDRVLDAAGRLLGRRKVDSVLADMRGVHEEFLQRFMASERRAIDLADKAAGRDPLRTVTLGDLRVLVVDTADDLAGAMTAAKPKGLELMHATSGGEGLDRISSGTFHYAMIAEDVADLPVMTRARDPQPAP